MHAAILAKTLPGSEWEIAIEQTVNVQVTPKPLPQSGELCVKMVAAALNRRDCFMCLNKYPHVNPPYCLGTDMAGIIDSVGQGVDETWIGKHVIMYVQSHKHVHLISGDHRSPISSFKDLTSFGNTSGVLFAFAYKHNSRT